MEKRVKAVLWILAVVLIAMLLIGFCTNEPTKRVHSTYTVRPGDTLYDVANEMGVQKWEEWRYEVCRMNNIKDGGAIYPGDQIIIYTEVE